MVDENKVQQQDGQNQQDNNSSNQQDGSAVAAPFQFDAMTMDEKTSPMTLDSMQASYDQSQNQTQGSSTQPEVTMPEQPEMPSLDAVPEMPTSENLIPEVATEEVSNNENNASVESTELPSVEQMPEIPTLDLGSLDMPLNQENTETINTPEPGVETASTEQPAMPEMPSLDLGALSDISANEEGVINNQQGVMNSEEGRMNDNSSNVTEDVVPEMPSLDAIPNVDVTENDMQPETKSDTTTQEQNTVSKELTVPDNVSGMPEVEITSNENKDSENVMSEETVMNSEEGTMKNEDSNMMDSRAEEVVPEMPVVNEEVQEEPVASSNQDNNVVEEVVSSDNTPVEDAEVALVDAEGEQISDNTIMTENVQPAPDSEVQAEQVSDSMAPVSEEVSESAEVNQEDAEGSLTVQFASIHELVKELFAVSRTAPEKTVDVVGMQSDSMTVTYSFSLPQDNNGVEIVKTTSLVEQEPKKAVLSLNYYDSSMQLDVLINGELVLQERNYLTDEKNEKHYVSDKLNKFTVLLESNIKKIKKKRRKEKEERKARKKLVAQLRDF